LKNPSIYQLKQKALIEIKTRRSGFRAAT